MRIKYTKREILGGLGAQVKVLKELIPFAEKFDLYVICDLRTFPYFRGEERDDKLAEMNAKSNQLLKSHRRIIYDTKRIDSISKSKIFDWDSWGVHCGIIKWLTDRSIEKRQWKEILHHEGHTLPLSTKDQLPIQIKDRALIEKYEARVRNSVAVHARLGNGEADFAYNPHRMMVSADKFIEKMEEHDGDFFISTDTSSFIDKCKNVFGDRVFHIDRTWMPEGCGPGHNIRHIRSRYSKEAKRQLKDKHCDSWGIFCDALTEMELLTKSKHLICNKSQFNLFARKSIPSTMVS